MIYKNHVHCADDSNFGKKMPEDAKLISVFNTLDPDQRHKISRKDFGDMIRNKAPLTTFMSRLRQKLLKGKERLHNVMLEDLQDVDRFFGAQGVLPLAVFQTIMIDYDLPMIDKDKVELTAHKVMFMDKEHNELVAYMQLFQDVGPKKKTVSMTVLVDCALKIQALVRGFLARGFARDLREQGGSHLKEDLKNMAQDKAAGKKAAVVPKKNMTKEERAKELKKKKEAMAKEKRLGARANADVNKRLDGVVRPPRDAKEKER